MGDLVVLNSETMTRFLIILAIIGIIVFLASRNMWNLLIAAVVVLAILWFMWPSLFGTREVSAIENQTAIMKAQATQAALRGVPPDYSQPVIPTVASGPVRPPAQPSGSASTRLNQVRESCTGPCSGRFGDLVESDGSTNPNGLKLYTGSPVTVTIPQGCSMDWYGNAGSGNVGPGSYGGIKEGSIRCSP